MTFAERNFALCLFLDSKNSFFMDCENSLACARARTGRETLIAHLAHASARIGHKTHSVTCYLMGNSRGNACSTVTLKPFVRRINIDKIAVKHKPAATLPHCDGFAADVVKLGEISLIYTICHIVTCYLVTLR